MLRHLAFRYVHKYVGDLEDVIKVRLDSSAPFLDFVLIACDLEEGLEFCYSPDYSRGQIILRSVFRLSLDGQ